jgi:multicomponent Na+:H+ antiporter subunit B
VDDIIVKTVSRILIPFIQVYSFYVIFYGHISPGGGFSGGAVLASSIVLYTIAFGTRAARKNLPNILFSARTDGGLLTFFIAAMTFVIVVKLMTQGLTFTTLIYDILIGLFVAATMITMFTTLIGENDKWS